MRRAAIAAVLLAACATPVGEDRSGCGPEWLDVDSVVTSARGADESPLPIDCVHQIANRRVRVGFTLPAGPSCHLLRRVELIESADAVSITLIGSIDDDPAAGACPEEPRRVATEIDLAGPIGDRTLLDGSGASE